VRRLLLLVVLLTVPVVPHSVTAPRPGVLTNADDCYYAEVTVGPNSPRAEVCPPPASTIHGWPF
jgi:hypothetical protein